MTRQLFTWCLLLFLIICPLQFLFAQEAPTSEKQFLKNFEAALKAKDKEGIMALYNWEGVSEEMKSLTSEVIGDLLQENVTSVKLSSVPADEKYEYFRDGLRFRPNVDIIGVIELHSSPDGGSLNTRIPYGKKGNVYYFPNAVGERAYEPTAKEKSLSISVMGTMAPKPMLFTGYCVYIIGDKEIKEEIKGEGPRSTAFWGDRIKYCFVQKTSVGGMIQLLIKEDDKTIFKSQREETDSPIIYDEQKF